MAEISALVTVMWLCIKYTARADCTEYITQLELNLRLTIYLSLWIVKSHMFLMLFMCFSLAGLKFNKYPLSYKTSSLLIFFCLLAYCPASSAHLFQSFPSSVRFCPSFHSSIHLSINQVGYLGQKLIRTKQSALCVSPLFIRGIYKPQGMAACVCVCLWQREREIVSGGQVSAY